MKLHGFGLENCGFRDKDSGREMYSVLINGHIIPPICLALFKVNLYF